MQGPTCQALGAIDFFLLAPVASIRELGGFLALGGGLELPHQDVQADAVGANHGSAQLVALWLADPQRKLMPRGQVPAQSGGASKLVSSV